MDIAIDRIQFSPTNPRKTIGKLDELAESIRHQGVLQRVLVRPLEHAKGCYELVFGERRVRAAQLAGLEVVPADVREMTDTQVLEAQLVENLQREDVHPLEEAEGFLKLHLEFDYSVDDIAARTGKSKATIYASLKLCALVPAAAEAFRDGVLPKSTALLIARVPQVLQQKALDEIVKGGEALSFRAAAELLQRRFMVPLFKAPFDTTDPELVPAAGTCVECPKRSGNDRPIFGDVERADVCTDPTCYEQKVDRMWELRTERAKGTGQIVLAKKECDRLFDRYRPRDLGWDTIYVDLDATCPDDEKGRTWRKLLGKADVVVHLARDFEGHPHELALKNEANVALKKAGVKVRAKTSTGGGDDAWKKEAEKRRKQEELDQAVIDRALPLIVDHVANHKPTVELWRLFARIAVDEFGADVVERRGLESLDALNKSLDEMDEGALRGLALEGLLCNYTGAWNGVDPQFRSAAELAGVDLSQLESEVKDEQEKAGAAAAAEAKAKKKAS